MRIISQDGTVDVPYEESIIAIRTIEKYTRSAICRTVGMFAHLENESFGLGRWEGKETSKATEELKNIRQSFLDGMPYHYIGGKENAS